MTTRKTTKRALLLSALSLLMCVSMLIGSTFAWFTDSVTSAGNKIVSGNLEIKLYSWENNDWSDISATSAPLFKDDVLWEPGFMQSKLLKVKNAGNLALKWQAQFVSNEELSILADAIDVFVCPGATELATTDRDLAGYTKVGSVRKFVNTISTTTVGQLQQNGDSATLGLVLKMREDAGNEYQNLTLGSFDIRIFATQLSYEGDSFGADYDTAAPMGVTASATMVTGQPTTLDFASAPSTTTLETSIEIPAGAYEGKEVTMTVTPTNSLFNISASGAVVGTIDVAMTVNGVETSEELENGEYTVTTYISKGLENVSVSYTGTDGKAQPTFVSYDANSGKLVFTTNHFSEYAVSGEALAFNVATDTALTDVVTILAAQETSNAVVIPQINVEAFATEVEEAIDAGLIKEETITKDDIYPVKVGTDYFTTLADAIAAADGKTVTVLNNITIDADSTITIPEGATVVLDLAGKTVAGTTDDADKNDDGKITSADNEVMIDVRGNLTVKNGTMTIKHESTNLGWNGCTEIFYVGFNGSLTVESATLKNLGGSDMAYAIDLVNAATAVTLNIDNSVIESTYIPVRVFNNGNGLNDVTIKNTELIGTSRALWVHIYTPADNTSGTYKDQYKDATLDLDFYGNGNTFKANNEYRIIEFGFTNPINFDANGGIIARNTAAVLYALNNNKDVALGADVKIDPASLSNAYGTTGINVKNGQTIDGNSFTLDIKGAGGTWDSGINTTGGLIKNIKVTGSFRGIFINHNSTYSEKVVLENVTIEGTTYTISCDQGTNSGFEATGSTFNGWTSYAATLGNAKFVNCSFGEGNGYAFCRPYAPTEFVDCNFETGYEMDPRAAVTFKNCTIGGVALTTENLSTLVTSNIANASVE